MTHSTTRARFAPSPTGAIHVGGVRTALVSWLYAHSTSGASTLRLEATDLERSNGEPEAGFLDDLRGLGVDRDKGQEIGGPYSPYREVLGKQRRAELLRAATGSEVNS